MKEALEMWKNTRMVALTALCAALYAALLIPFKAIPLIPGFTEIRPAAAIPILTSFMFGPAGAWGSAIGNLIGDFFGTLSAGSLFGFIANFIYGFIPYFVWSAIKKDADPLPGKISDWILYVMVLFLASAGCGFVVGWGVHILGFLPFSALANIVTINNFITSLILTTILLFLLYPRVKNWGILYKNLVPLTDKPGSWRRIVALVLIFVGVFGGILVGNLISLGFAGGTLFGPGPHPTSVGSLSLGLSLLPFFALIILGLILI
ncbi:MAG: QueT transporter family protein [Candidatus Tectomicrobia bacterium]|uniref:QueT transporter family protein n=1 Tax=Tectimicrobiota bacterium TaxID=2528274 RepID=A0A933GP29_UNCTE|nr:QueT transporter family protein [Candidatus Tectomicrobia bacterium]